MKQQWKTFYKWWSPQHEELYQRITVLGKLKITTLDLQEWQSLLPSIQGDVQRIDKAFFWNLKTGIVWKYQCFKLLTSLCKNQQQQLLPHVCLQPETMYALREITYQGQITLIHLLYIINMQGYGLLSYQCLSVKMCMAYLATAFSYLCSVSVLSSFLHGSSQVKSQALGHRSRAL